MSQKWLLLGVFITLLFSCKVSKAPKTKVSVELDSLLAKDTSVAKTYLITQKGDTLDSLGIEVDISISRLLPDTVAIAAVGDIMMGTQFPNKSYLPLGNGSYLWDDVKNYLKGADITFGNLEGTILDGPGEQKQCQNPKACYLFKMPGYLSGNLSENGFDLLSLANNHANDFGAAGRHSTQKILDSLKIITAGSIEKPYILEKIGHLKIGFVAFAPNRGTLTFYDLNNAKKIVSELDTIADIVVVSIHGGAEGAKNMHVTREVEYYFGENRGNIYDFAHHMIDSGADLILGHGPHVVRAIEVYKGKMIAYSLGNFLTYGRFNLRGPNAHAPILMVKTDSKGVFLEGQIIPFLQSYTLGPRYDENKSVIEVMRKLSSEDFPENEIIIDDEGRIFYIQN